MVEHRGFVNMSLDQIRSFGIDQSDRVLQFASPSFDASLSEIFMALFAGAAVVLIDPESITHKERFLAYLGEKGVTVVTLPPAYLSSLGRDGLGTVKTIITAGEPAVMKDALYYGRNKNYFNAYGPTEASVCATWHKVDPDGAYADKIPIGKPVSNTGVFILDESMSPVPVGVAGEICISGVGLARGYINNPELTEHKFVKNHYSQEGRLYRTGDAGRWLPSGDIEFLGRTDDQVKIRGYRIEPGEIEHNLLEHLDVKEAAVVTKTIGGSEELAAYIVTDSDDNIIVELKSFLGKRLPSYMVPHFFMRLDTLPVTANGKIDRKALPQPDTMRSGISHCPPGNELEKQLANIWEEVLQQKDIGIDNNFFELGGNSLKAIRVLSMIRRDLNRDMTLLALFQAQTIRELAAHMTKIDSAYDLSAERTIIQLCSGGGRAVFFLPCLPGYAAIYRGPAGYLHGYSVYGLNFMEDGGLLDEYVSLIREVRERSPYVLIGYSGGGNLSFELSKKLSEKGHIVSDIILIDSWKREKKVRLTDEDRNSVMDEYLKDFIAFADAREASVSLNNDASLRERVMKKMTGYMNYIDNTVNTGVTRANIHLITAEPDHSDNRLKAMSLSRDWKAATSGKFEIYRGAGKHSEMLTGGGLGGNMEIIRDILFHIFRF